MMALLMLSLMIVGLLGLLGTLLVSSTKSTDTTAGTYAAQYLLEAATVSGLPDPTELVEENGKLVQSGEVSLLSHEEKLPVKFQYRLEWGLVGEIRTYSRGGETEESQFGARLYHVRATVWWMTAKAGEGRAEGGGKRTVTLERLIRVSRT